jgi:hypothetical protein
VDALDGYTKDELDPKVPTPIEVLLYRATSDAAYNYTAFSEAISQQKTSYSPEPKQDHSEAQSTANC